jgi:signal peptidase I
MTFIRDIIITIIISILVFFCLQFTMANLEVFGICMHPNVEHGDRIIVSKLSYQTSPPERGDVIVFHSPRDSGTDLIKRVIALPGETVEVRDGTVYINGSPLEEPYLNERPEYEYPQQTLPEDQYFVLGDNRNNSADSHNGWLLPEDNIIGKAWVIYWPFERLHPITHYAFNQNGRVVNAAAQ